MPWAFHRFTTETTKSTEFFSFFSVGSVISVVKHFLAHPGRLWSPMLFLDGCILVSYAVQII